MSLVCLDSWLIGQVARVGTTDEIRVDERGRVIVISLVFLSLECSRSLRPTKFNSGSMLSAFAGMSGI